MTNFKWRRLKGQGYDLEGTDYGVRTEFTGYSDSEQAALESDGTVVGREYALVRLSTDENLDWFDRCKDAKAAAERMARRDYEARLAKCGMAPCGCMCEDDGTIPEGSSSCPEHAWMVD